MNKPMFESMKLVINGTEQSVRVYNITKIIAYAVVFDEYHKQNSTCAIIRKATPITLQQNSNAKFVVSYFDNEGKFKDVIYKDVNITIPTGYTIYDADLDNNNSKGGRRMRHKRTKRSKRTRCNTRKRIIRRR